MGILLYNDILSLLRFWHLLDDKLVKHLLFETERRDSEVEKRNLHLSLRGVVRVG